MIRSAALAQPIRGGISKDGRLVFADAALRQLHIRAGGVDGGVLAIPGLAALAALTHQLKMRLSRAVTIADANEDLDLWVEASFEGDEAKISILSWRISAVHETQARPVVNNSVAGAPDDKSIIEFDSELRLLSAAGAIGASLERADFGEKAPKVIAKILPEGDISEALLKAMRDRASLDPTADASGATVWGEPKFDEEAVFSGYRCWVKFDDLPASVAPTPALPSILFGRQLAPVLRQPLGRIIANAETIGAEMNGPIRENYALYAKDIAIAARHLVALVDDLGDLEAVEQSNFETAKDQIELGDVARRVAGLLALKAADHSIRIISPPESQIVPAVAEFRRVLQILLNLVTNAIRYSSDGTEVKIDIAVGDGESTVSVTDEGAGINPEDRERIFEKFERLGRSGDGGSGLGLYISRRLARAMGGELTVNNAVAGGATFTLRLPSQ